MSMFLMNCIFRSNKLSAACGNVQFIKHQREHHCIESTLNDDANAVKRVRIVHLL